VDAAVALAEMFASDPRFRAHYEEIAHDHFSLPSCE
jgi:hypothetical protein